MAKVKVIKTSLDGNLNGSYFNDTPSNTIFSFGKFFVTSNFDDKTTIDYNNSLSSFVRPITLEIMNVTDIQSEILQSYSTNVVLNLDKSNLNTFVRYGSAYEFLRISVQNIILSYPGSLFANSQIVNSDNTYVGLEYDVVTNSSIFYAPIEYLENIFGLIINNGNLSIPDDNELKNLNLSYDKYVIWSKFEPETYFTVIGYTGNTINSVNYYPNTTILESTHIRLLVSGNPFNVLGSGTTGNEDYHIRPNNIHFEEFRAVLGNYEQNIVSRRDGTRGFVFTLKDPTLLDNGNIVYSDLEIVWNTSDYYNIDINTSSYERLLETLLTIGNKYDKIKTDLIARFLTPSSLKTYDLTEEGKITKLLRIYGYEFDQIRHFIDSLVNINRISYDKINNVPDQLIKNMATTFGWDYFSLVNEDELVDGFLTIDDTERNLNESILPVEIDIELWRRILNNTNYFWKSKGTRQAIKSMFLLVGIPEPFINISEYVYTVDGKIDPNTVSLNQGDFPSNSLPYDNSGYPVAPLETNDFYFQTSGNTDSGQAYLDVFRMAGFNLKPVVDNKKSWVQTGSTTRIHNTTPQYYQEDSKLVINTKELSISLDTARGIEYDVFEYIKEDFIINSTGYTLAYSYVNISSLSQNVNVFTLPDTYNHQGDFEVRFNGILLNGPNVVLGSTSQPDYSVNGNEFTIFELSGGTNSSDIIQATFINSGETAVTGITVQYVVTRVSANLNGTYVPLPTFPRGDVQLTINGISLTKGTSQFVADYILDPANSTGGTNQIIIQNPDVILYLSENPNVQISYVEVLGNDDIDLRSEIVRVDSFNTNKIYFNNSANKYVYKLNYMMNNASDVKILINGIALEPNTDYSINVQNPYELFLPKGITYGTVITAYYLVGGDGALEPVVSTIFGLGDITKLSFLEFIDMIQRKMINVRNRKTISDFKGGWYPTLLRIYETYLKRALLSDDNPLQSNGYTFQNLYSFLNKYNSFFQRFVDQLLGATVITKKGGLLIRNSVFTRQKHWYKRGVNVAKLITDTPVPVGDDNIVLRGAYEPIIVNPVNGNTVIDARGNELIQYLGDDGSTFQIIQATLPPIPPPTQMYVETIEGVLGSIITGGENIIGFDDVITYGVEYRLIGDDWIIESETGSIDVDNFNITLTGLEDDTTYEYRAFIQSLSTGATGNIRQITTPPAALPDPSIDTVSGVVDGYFDEGIYYGRLLDTGGQSIVRYDEVQYYAVRYKIIGNEEWFYSPEQPSSGPLQFNYFSNTINNLVAETNYEYQAYMVVDGNVYVGLIGAFTTLAEPTFAPSGVYTGSVDATTINTINITGNYLENRGIPDEIIEYGILWTTNSGLGTTNNLLYSDPLVGGIYKDSITANITPYDEWDGVATDIPAGTIIYYRAFARNAAGVSYGAVGTESTTLPINVYLTNLTVTTPIGGIFTASAKIETSEPLTSGMGFSLTYNAEAWSVTPVNLDRSISARSCVMKNSYNCGGASSNANTGSGAVDCYVSNDDNVIQLDSTESNCISDYCVWVKPSGNLVNYDYDYINRAKIEITSISNFCGGSYVLTNNVIDAINDTNNTEGGAVIE